MASSRSRRRPKSCAAIALRARRKSTLLELTQSRALQLQAASAVVSAQYTVVFQRALISYFTGELDPVNVSLSG